MEFGMKRVVASVQVVAILNRIYNGSPVSIASISKESKLSVSYLEQIFSKLRSSEIVTSWRRENLLPHKAQNPRKAG